MEKRKKTQLNSRPLEKLINDAGYTLKEFAQALNVSYSAVRYYNSGGRVPSAIVVAKMCQLLNKSPKVVLAALGIDITGIPNDSNAS